MRPGEWVFVFLIAITLCSAVAVLFVVDVLLEPKKTPADFLFFEVSGRAAQAISDQNIMLGMIVDRGENKTADFSRFDPQTHTWNTTASDSTGQRLIVLHDGRFVHFFKWDSEWYMQKTISNLIVFVAYH